MCMAENRIQIRRRIEVVEHVDFCLRRKQSREDFLPGNSVKRSHEAKFIQNDSSGLGLAEANRWAVLLMLVIKLLIVSRIVRQIYKYIYI